MARVNLRTVTAHRSHKAREDMIMVGSQAIMIIMIIMIMIILVGSQVHITIALASDNLEGGIVAAMMMVADYL